MIEEDQVNAEALADIFRAAFMDVSAVTGDSFTVKGIQFPFRLAITVEPGHKLISFMDRNRLHRINFDQALHLCNEANLTLGPARFLVMQHQDALVAITHYQMTYERGLVPFHLVASFRTFEYCVGNAVRGLFKDYLRPA